MTNYNKIHDKLTSHCYVATSFILPIFAMVLKIWGGDYKSSARRTFLF